MSVDMIRYADFGATKQIPFKLVNSSGVGVNPTLQAGDVRISLNTGTGFSASSNVTNLPTAIDATNLTGWFRWQPTAAETTCYALIVNIKDQTATPVWVENAFVLVTGGDTSAFYSGS